MKWINPIEKLPKINDIIWILIRNWKKHRPCSYEICAGEVNIDKNGDLYVINDDYIGGGSLTFSFRDSSLDDQILAWSYYEEGDLPTWDYPDNYDHLNTSQKKYYSQRNKAWGMPHFDYDIFSKMRFVSVKEGEPKEAGIYVVAKKDSAPWFMEHNGQDWVEKKGFPAKKTIEYWFPIPKYL